MQIKQWIALLAAATCLGSWSGTALARLFVALIETWQQADGSVEIPGPLQPYLKADRIKI